MNPHANRKPPLLLYCQHSLGMGHLVRSLALGEGLSQHFRVVMLNGGPLPEGIRTPREVEIIDLPALGFDSQMQLVGRAALSVQEAQSARRRMVLETFRELRPSVIVIELFPFGRKKFAFELLPLLEEAAKNTAARPVVACSLRDILVNQRRDQQHHDDRAARLCNRFFDVILVHADPAFARLEDTFQPRVPLQPPVRYTGFVLPGSETPLPWKEARPQILVSAGGGLVGEPLLRATIESFRAVRKTLDVSLKVVAGPFLPEPEWASLQALARAHEGVEIVRSLPDLAGEMSRSRVSISQCGYNTCLDILRARVPALVVPFGEGLENEQMNRARRLEQLGAVRVLPSKQMNPDRMAQEMLALFRFRPNVPNLDMQGAKNSAEVLSKLAQRRSADNQVSVAAIGALR